VASAYAKDTADKSEWDVDAAFGGAGPENGGRGWRNMFYATGLPRWARAGGAVTPTPAQELGVLKQQAEHLGNALENTRKRIQEIESQPAQK